MLQFLALLPFIHFITIYFVSKKRKTQRLLFDLWAIPYLDWFYVPFNFFIATSIQFSWVWVGIFFVISLGGSIYLHYKWKPKQDSRKQYFFHDKKGLTPEGWIHLVFMVIQGALVLTALAAKPTSVNYVFMMLSLLGYLAGYYVIVKFIRKNLNGRAEMPFILLGIFIVVLRIILYF